MSSLDADMEQGQTARAKGFTITVNDGQNDYANCAGTYLLFPPDRSVARIYLRKKNIYYNEEKNRIAFYDGSAWSITAAKAYFIGVMKGTTGAFYRTAAGTSPFIASIWLPRYTMTSVF